LLNNVGALVKAHHAQELANSELLTKDAVRQLANEVVGIVTDELSSINGYEEIVDRICVRLTRLVERVRN
jgi:hypothetical protein